MTTPIMDIMAVFVVSGSVVLLAHKANKRLVADFMKKIESELGSEKSKDHSKKKVRFADDVVEPSCDNKEYRKNGGRLVKHAVDDQGEVLVGCSGKMPLNRQILYKGILQYRMLKGAAY